MAKKRNIEPVIEGIEGHTDDQGNWHFHESPPIKVVADTESQVVVIHLGANTKVVMDPLTAAEFGAAIMRALLQLR